MCDTPVTDETRPLVAVVGGGPAGLMAAEVLSQGGVRVVVYDTMPSVGRKLLLAGRGGLNLTHSEPLPQFLGRYGTRQAQVQPWLAAFGPLALRTWAQGLGIATFVGSSGRVFPSEMKAAPLLRAWLRRLRAAGVQFQVRHRWLGWDAAGQLRFATPAGEHRTTAAALVLALGGGSWAKLGSDGAWVPLLAQQGVPVAALRPANCGFEVAWSAHFRERFAGQPLKSIVMQVRDATGTRLARQGECVVTATGLEGGVIYALSALLRDQLEATGTAQLWLDLVPGKSLAELQAALAQPRGGRSWAKLLQSRAGLHGVKAGLLREVLSFSSGADSDDPARLAALIKALPVRLSAVRPLAEAISSAGGVQFEALDAQLMLRELPGVFCAGEMLDWEAPTGGYLLTACFASGYHAGKGVLKWLDQP